MENKIFRNMLSIALLAVILATFLIIGALYNFFGKRIQQEMRNQATYLTAALNREKDKLSYLAASNTSATNPRLTLIAHDGTVLYDSITPTSAMENHLNRPEVLAALRDGYGESSRLSITLDERTLYSASRLDDGSVIRLASIERSAWGILLSLFSAIAMIVITTVIISSLLANHVTKSIIRPINELDLENPLANEVYDELAPLLLRIASQNKQIVSQLRELEEKQDEFTAITENMREGLIILNTQSSILAINQSAVRLFKVSGYDCLGKHILTLNRSLALQRAVEKASLGQPYEEDLDLDGRHYQLLASPVKDKAFIRGLVLLILDITEKQAVEKMRREFSANVSHELKTPLTSISGYAEIMKNGLVKQEDMVEFSKRIYDESTRLITLVEDIIQLSRLDENNLEVPHEKVDLFDLAQEVCHRLAPLAQQAGVTIDVQGESTIICGIRQVLEEMMYNLCDNAIKYNRKNGTVKITASSSKDAAILSVVDNGIGIPMKYQSRVFERFYRVDKSHSKDTGGTGLGLSIVKRGALYHNAKIRLESTLDQGTTVSIYFPL